VNGIGRFINDPDSITMRAMSTEKPRLTQLVAGGG
jgi:hypothetical protein